MVTVMAGTDNTGLVTVLVTQVAALPQPGVITSVKLAWFEIVELLASLALTVTWNVKLLVLNAGHRGQCPCQDSRGEHHAAVRRRPTTGRGRHVCRPAGMASVTMTGPDAVPPEFVTAN